MYKKTKNFLMISFGGLVVLCIVIFLWLGTSMSGKSKDTINEIGRIYMSEMSKQLQQKFNAITALWVSQADGIIKRTPPEDSVYGEELLDELAQGYGNSVILGSIKRQEKNRQFTENR